MRRKHVNNVLLIVCAIAIAYLVFQMASPFFVAITWAAVFATIIAPVHSWIRDRVGNHSLAALLSVAIVLLCIIVPLIALGLAVWREVAHAIPPDSDAESIRGFMLAKIAAASEWIRDRFGVDALNANQLQEAAEQLRHDLPEYMKSVAGGVAGFVGTLVIVLFTLFFFLRDRDVVVRTLKGFMPLSDENATRVLNRSRNVVVASVLGGGAVALAQGTLAGMGFWALSIHSPAMWALATAICSFIPLVGAAAVWVPMTLVLLATGHWGKAIALGLWGALGISLVDNIIRPIVIGDATKLHTLLIFFSILGGVKVFGFVGIVMGPVVLAVGLALVDIFKWEIEEEERVKNGEPTDESRDMAKAELEGVE